MEKKKVKLLAIQMESAIGNIDLNIETVKNLLKANLDKYGECDFVFLPELWPTGWDCPSFPKTAETLQESRTVKMLQKIAREYKVNIIGGSFVNKCGDKLYNSCPVINRAGEVICTYDKNHLYSYNGDTENRYITTGNNPVMAELEGVKLGLTICYDIRFPEIYRAYRKAGADILVNMAAWPKSRKIHWDTLARARAVENQSYMIALTQTGLLSDGSENLGHSMIIDFDGKIIAEIEDNEGAGVNIGTDESDLQTGVKEGAIYAEINLEKMYEFRSKCTNLKDVKDSYEVIKK